MKQAPNALAVVAWVLVASLAGACRQDTPGSARRPAEEPSRPDFKAGHVRAINQSDRPEAQGKANEEAPKVIAFLNDYYGTAFLDKAKWANGTHPGLAEFFTPEARTQIAPNLGALALGDLAPRLRSVTPTKQDAPRITLYIEDDLSVPFGVVSSVFEARAAPQEGRSPVAILHNANFWLVKEGDSLKIYAYSSELKADSQTKAAAFGKTEGEGLR